MAHRYAVPIFSSSKVDLSESVKGRWSPRSGNITPRSCGARNPSSNTSTPLSSKVEDDNGFKTPKSLDSSRQRWRSASALSEHGKSKEMQTSHTCSSRLSPKASRANIHRFCSDNSLNDSANLETSISTPTSPRGEAINFVVGVRVRPFNNREEKDKTVRNVVVMKGSEVSLTCGSGTIHTFSYDHCFWSFDTGHEQYASQTTVFSIMVEPLLDQLMLGYNACLLAYGQTGSGKSYSMMGLDGGPGEPSGEAGIIPRFCSALFERAARETNEICIEISFYEIYNEKIHDLLANHTDGPRPALRVREHPVLGPHVVDLAVHGVTSFCDVKGWLTVGNSHRITAATGVNETSSRSHSIFSVIITQKSEGVTCRSRANLVDLAGSERVAQTAATGHQLKEGVSINKSLLSLGKVITFLSERSRRRGSTSTFGPYRESVLTWLLRESLGGNSKTAMLATISPANVHLDETLATLRYACQARSIVNRVHRNEDPNERIIRELRMELEQVAALRAELDQIKKMAELSGQDQAKAKQEEIDRLKLQLKEAEAKVAQDQRPWQEKLQNASERKCAELQYLRGCGVAVESSVDPSQPCLVTLSADPILSGTLLYLLPLGSVTVGRAADADIVLHGPLVSQVHCEIENTAGCLCLKPVNGAETFVNGISVTRDTELKHGDRLAIGGVHFFRVRAVPETVDTNNVLAGFEQAQRELKREQEARLRSELRAELDAAHAQELSGMVALLDAQSCALQEERRFKTALKAERDDLQARVEGQELPSVSDLTPYRSTFLQELHAIVARQQRPDDLSLLDTHLLVREATQRCQDLDVGLEFFQEQLAGESGLEPVVRVCEFNQKLTSIWQPDQFLGFLNVIREQESKEVILDELKNMEVTWEKSAETSRPSRRISVKRRSLAAQTQNSSGDMNAVASSLHEMQRQAARLADAAAHDEDLRAQLDRAMPHFQAFVSALAVSGDCSSKTVRFAATT